MKEGITTQDVEGSFSSTMIRFNIPKGTKVFFGQPDCMGDSFPHWALSPTTATELSGNEWDSTHRFCIVPTKYVKETS